MRAQDHPPGSHNKIQLGNVQTTQHPRYGICTMLYSEKMILSQTHQLQSSQCKTVKVLGRVSRFPTILENSSLGIDRFHLLADGAIFQGLVTKVE